MATSVAEMNDKRLYYKCMKFHFIQAPHAVTMLVNMFGFVAKYAQKSILTQENCIVTMQHGCICEQAVKLSGKHDSLFGQQFYCECKYH